MSELLIPLLTVHSYSPDYIIYGTFCVVRTGSPFLKIHRLPITKHWQAINPTTVLKEPWGPSKPYRRYRKYRIQKIIQYKNRKQFVSLVSLPFSGCGLKLRNKTGSIFQPLLRHLKKLT